MHTGNAGFPVGGSLEFARAIERRFLALGGEIQYDSQVQKVLVRDGRAAGVRLYDDTEHWADIVISAADGRGTLFDWLGEEHLDRDLRRTYDGHLPIHSVVQVSLGVGRDLSAEPHWASYLLDEPLTIATQPVRDVGVKHYCFDSTLAPAGKSAVTLLFEADYHYWQRIYARRIYDREQSQISDTVCAFLDGLYPGFSNDVEVKDVATPMSYERFTGNWLGSSCGWLLTKDTMRLMIQGLPKTLPRLGNFYMAGQWVEPGGSVPVAAMSGRNAIQLICHEAGRPFQTSLP
jgi:phytoene dehydrogenase-like protein